MRGRSYINERAMDDYLRAPWMFKGCPFRFRVSRVREAPVALWAATPIFHFPHNEWKRMYGTGQRILELPPLSIVAATWREAMDYVTHGAYPRRALCEVYPEYCGMSR